MILNIKKEKNWTSFDVVAKTRSLLGIKKVGHAGTLDPLATGVLILLTDKDTKKQSDIMQMEKEYIAEVVFGASSPTYDMEGPLLFEKPSFTLDELTAELPLATKKYIGEIDQIVPAYSATKVGGTRLYKQAREGKIDDKKLPSKKVKIYTIEISDFYLQRVITPEITQELPAAKMTIRCGSGTYVRSLAHDLGKDIGSGAVLFDLIRTRVGNYTIEDSRLVSELV